LGIVFANQYTMKHLVICVAIVLTVFIACQKTINWDLSPEAHASIVTDSFGNCLPIPVHGLYKVDSALTDSNYIVVHVNVDSPGAYTIYTNYINGYTFTATGNFAEKGIAEVKLVGSGKPEVSEVDTFTVHLDSSACSFTVNVLAQDSDSSAAFELVGDESGNCSNAAVNGAYTAGQPLADSNKVVLQVNVTVPGVYNVITDVVNGMSFASSGTFTSSGIQNITLKGSGTPTVIGDNAIPVTVDTTKCSFIIPVK
jgi:hypothetical protein